MKAAINSLGHVLYAPSQYLIPVFQRNYRWERPQWEKLWASLAGIQQPDKIGNHGRCRADAADGAGALHRHVAWFHLSALHVRLFRAGHTCTT